MRRRVCRWLEEGGKGSRGSKGDKGIRDRERWLRYGKLGRIRSDRKSESFALALKKKDGQPEVARWTKIYYRNITIRGLPAFGGTAALLWPGTLRQGLRRFPRSGCERWPFH